jgi:hypothetical protein
MIKITRAVFRFPLVLSVLGFAPLAHATLFTGTFTSTTNTATATLANFGGATGLSLTSSCGDAGAGIGGNACTLANALSGAGGTFSLGVNTTGDGLGNTSNPVQGTTQGAPSNELIEFTFSSAVTLTGAHLDFITTGTAQNAYAVYTCTTAACTSRTLLTSGTSNANGNAAISFSGISRFFEIAVNGANTQMGVNSLTFDTSTVPEPATYGMMGLGLGLLGLARFRRRT